MYFKSFCLLGCFLSRDWKDVVAHFWFQLLNLYYYSNKERVVPEYRFPHDVFIFSNVVDSLICL